MFSRLYGLSIVVFLGLRSPSSRPKMNTKKTPCEIQSVLLFLMCFSFVIMPPSEVKRFCLFRSEGCCLITTPLSVRYVGKKCHLACSLDSGSKLSLVKSAGAGNTSGKYLCALGNELSELCDILVIDLVHFILAEDANILSSV